MNDFIKFLTAATPFIIFTLCLIFTAFIIEVIFYSIGFIYYKKQSGKLSYKKYMKAQLKHINF